MKAQTLVAFAAAFAVLLMPAAARSQAVSSGIAGEVRDASGAVLPGVTVEASSPSLIERVRNVVTDERGQYKVLDLRPGTYTVTFTLAGFSPMKREGLELSAGFTATVNAELRVGAVEETITVSGASPVVDTQNVRTQNLVTREVLDTLPSGKTMQGYAAFTVGAVASGNPDVGGDKGEQYNAVAIHGTAVADGRLLLDGMTFNSMSQASGGADTHYHPNSLLVEEITLELSGKLAEADSPGVFMNVVPKAGGNAFSGSLVGFGTAPSFQADNTTDELRALGVTTRPGIKKNYDWGGGFGGPIVRNHMWFYTAHRWWGAQNTVPTSFINTTPNTLFYTPDRSQAGFTNAHQQDNSARVTWQATTKHKLTFMYSRQDNCNCGFLGTQTGAPSFAVDYADQPTPIQAMWFYSPSSRLLIDVGYTHFIQYQVARPAEGVKPTDISITDLSTGYQYNSFANPLTTPGNLLSLYSGGDFGQDNTRVSLSYVTGSHAFKFGGNTQRGGLRMDYFNINQSLSYTFLNPQTPSTLTQYATPGSSNQQLKLKMGLYAQDQWTINRLTLSPGLRFDYLNAYVPAQTRAPGRFIGAINIPEVSNRPMWTDLSPRVGAAYDLFGNGKTAIKGMVGRYVGTHGVDIALLSNPANALVAASTRNWNDTFFPVGDPRRGNFVPDCDLSNLSVNDECGAGNPAFGTPNVVTRYATDVLEGFGTRDFQWQASLGAQHELRPGFGLSATYFRYWRGNIFATDNLAVAPSDYSTYCVTTPSDARLPGGGGQQVCGLWDIAPGKFGQTNNLVTQASNFGDPTEVTNSVDVVLNGRFGHGGRFSGGVSSSRTVTNNCFTIDSPQQGPATAASQPTSFCKVTPPWSAGTQLKVNGSYPLRWDIVVSGVLQNLPGTQRLANIAFTNAQIRPSLGRDLGSCRGAAVCNGVATVSVIPPGTQYGSRLSQLDLRLSKGIKLANVRAKGMFDAYNVFNSDFVASQSATFAVGQPWPRPATLLGGRLVKLGVQLDF